MRATLFLTLVAALLAAYILLFERHHASTDERRADHTRLLPRFDRHQVRQVTITRRGEAPFSLARDAAAQPAAWRVMPGDKPADEAAVEELFTELDFADADRDADLTPAAAGLAAPAVKLDIEIGADRIALALGRVDATGRGLFVQTGGDARIRVAPRRLLDLADRDPTAFRDRRAVPAAVVGNAGLALSWNDNGGPARALRQVGGRWQNEQQSWASGDRVAEASRRLADLHAELFVPPPQAPAPPRHTLEVSVDGRQRWTLLARDGGCAAPEQALLDRNGPTGADWLCVSAEALRALWHALEAAHARDDRLVAAAPEAITAIDLIAGTKHLALRGAHGRWTFVDPTVDYAADAQAIGDWLAALARVRLDLAAPVRPSHGATTAVQLKLDNPRFVEAIEVSSAAVHRTGETTPAPTPPGLLDLLQPEPLRFRDRAVLDLARFDARRLQITGPAQPQRLVLAKGDGEVWQVTAPAGAPPADGAAVDRVLGALTNLHAQEFLPAASAPAPELTFDLTEQPPGATAPLHHVVELGPRRPDGCLARLKEKGAGTTFVLAPSVCDDLRAPLLRRAP